MALLKFADLVRISMGHSLFNHSLRSGVLLMRLLPFVIVSVGQPAAARDNVVLQWNTATLDAIGNTRTPPPIAARAFAIANTAMFDAWAAYDYVAKGIRFGYR